MMTYTNIQRIAFLFHFFHTKLIPKPPGLLLCSLNHHYIRPPHPRRRCLASCRPCVLCRDALQKRRHSSGGCWLLSSPPSQVYIYIERNVIEDVKGNSEVGGFWGTVLVIGIVRIGQSSSSERHSFGGFEQKVRRSKVCSRVRVASLCCRP